VAGKPRRIVGRSRTSQQGQVLVMALGLMLLGAAGLYLMFSAGQLLTAKHRLVNAADASAWSAGVWRARVLNYHAYSNRAIVANEVAIAQAVTLASWAGYFESITRNAATVGAYLPPLRPVLEGVAGTAYLAKEATRSAAAIEVAARGAAMVGYKEILQTSQEILHLTTHVFGMNAVVAEVARANDPGYFAFLLPEEAAWSSLTRRYTTDADRQRMAGVAVGSMDAFTSGSRSQDIWTPVPSPCLNFMRIRKRGGTELMPTLDRWESVDTMSFHARTLSGLRCREREALPLAWGSAEGGPLPGRNAVLGSGGGTHINPSATRLAAGQMDSFGPYAGISRTRELDYERLADPAFPTHRIGVVARQRATDVRTAQNRRLAQGEVLPREAQAGQYVWALSAAEVYFRRPAHAPSRIEFASLYSPYWQVRLVEPSALQRLAAHAHAR
jgi:hypothetical protein